MVAEQAETTAAPEREYDPEYQGEQSEASLLSLIGRIEGETQELQFPSFDQDDAVSLGLLLVELGRERKLPIAIDIRRGNHILFHAALPGATADNDSWIERKSRTAERYAVPSLLVGLRNRVGGGRIEDFAWFDVKQFAADGGSFPLYVKGTGAVGTVTVSGLPQKADHELVVEALRAFAGRQGRPSA